MTRTHEAIFVPISVGELIDKITILRLKSERISDSSKLTHVHAELAALTVIYTSLIEEHEGLEPLTTELHRVNEALWEIEDEIRELDHRRDFGVSFVALARSVYLRNDERAAIKQRINRLTGSAFVEEKSYADHSAGNVGSVEVPSDVPRPGLPTRRLATG